MFKKNTVIVLGAAVSHEVGLPLGWGLKNRILEILPDQQSGNEYVRQALFMQQNVNVNAPACREIRRALPKAASIDNLIEHRGDDPAFTHCSKVGIIAAIVEGERASDLYRPEGATLGTISAEQTSYADLFRIMVGSASRAKLPQALRRVKFINFNYDRCLEHYLFDWLIGYSGLNPVEAAHLVSNELKVVRPYGSIGRLPIGLPQAASTDVAFGADLRELDLNGLAENILTFSEERGSDVDVAVKQMMTEADQLIVLGCAFHPQNIALLEPPTSRFRNAYGTCYVIPPKDPEGHSSPDLDRFALPTAKAFHAAFENMKLADGWIGIRNLTFEALTTKQLIAKFAPRWS
jgi:hypothetical protein